MLTGLEKKALAVLLVVTVILAGFAFFFGVIHPDAGTVQYDENTPDKTRVTFTGEISSMKITSTGGHVLLNVSGVTVFVENGAENIFYKAGDTVRVVGIAETYNGKREIAVGASGSLELAE